MNAPWEPYDDLIARGLAAGQTFSQITIAILEAGRAHTTRNAVMGRAHRLGLASAVKPGCGQVRVARKRVPRTVQERAKPAVIRRQARGESPNLLADGEAARRAPSPRAVRSAKPAVPRQGAGHAERFRVFRAAFLPLAQAVPLRDIGAGACRRPVGGGAGADLLMCGARVKGAGSYCRACTRLLYAPRERAPALPRLAGVGTVVAAASAAPAEGEVDLVDQFGEDA